MMDIEEIKELMPHRYPFLLVDRVINLEKGKSITVLKNVTINEPTFQGHFPGKAVLPGVIIIEAMAQASGLLARVTIGDKSTGLADLYYFAGIDNAKFKRVVVPGDQLEIYVEIIKEKRNYAVVKTRGTARVNGEIVCTADILCAKKSKDTEEGSE
jgi:3-hydroxyacyl-[acyl-carrier-protein] dehydratase